MESLSLELVVGYIDSKKAAHRDVTFGNRINGAKLFDIDEDPQAKLPTQYQLLLVRAAITKFGSLELPVSLKVLLGLDSLDLDDLNEKFKQFIESGVPRMESQGTDKIKLPIGYERNGLTYDIVEFGPRLTGMDDVEADALNLEGIRRLCFLAGKQVSRLSQSEGKSVLDGPLVLEIFERLDVVDIYAIKAGSEIFRQSFRLPGKGVHAVGSGQDSAAVS